MIHDRTAAAAPSPNPPPAPPPPPRKSSATVHLCAGVYLDEEFRNRVLRDVYHRPHRALAPNPGADAVPVVQHALRARRITLVRAAVTLVLALLALVIAPGSILAAIAILMVWQLVVSTARLTVDAARYTRTGEGRPWRLAIRFVLTALLAAAAAFLLTATGALALASGLEDASTASTQAPPSGGAEVSPVLWLVLLALITVGFELGAVHLLKTVPDSAEPPAGHDPRLGRIAANRDPQVVNYAADRSPFVGSGTELATWQFALPLRPKRGPAGDHDRPWPHFDTVSLSRHVKDAIAELAHDTSHSRHLPGLRLTDHVFVSGHDTVQPTHGVGELAASGYPHRSLQEVQNDPTTPIRHYLRCQIVSWDGELVTTVFMHTALQGETLYLEFSSFMLPPTKAAYHAFGRESLGRTAAMAWGAVRSLVRLPAVTGRGIADLAAVAREGLRRRGQSGAPQWAVRGSDDFGAEFGIRELGSDEDEHHYFQHRDVVKYTKILERQLLATVVDYLSDKIDVAELTNRAETIINAGVVNYGHLQAGAVGPGAAATVGAIGEGSGGTVRITEGAT
ncbi:MAG TPA: hypothetical protein VFU12_05875 [Glycomyces sp.]|nr:hypothetical protein [Glycomyces sp.]